MAIAAPRMMRHFAKWHIWLGWLIGIPLLLWTATGLVMVIKPIEEVRGEHLRSSAGASPLPLDATYSIELPAGVTEPVETIAIRMKDGEPIFVLTYIDGRIERYAENGDKLPTLNEVAAKALVARSIVGGDRQESATFYRADDVPFDFRRPVDVWQIALEDGTYVYVGQHTGEIEAVRTRWWRVFDFAWGLHIMDLSEREDTSHPVLIVFAALGVVGSILGIVLLFRRRKVRIQPRG